MKEGRKEGKGYEGRKLPQTRLPAHQCFPFSHPLPCFSQQNGMVRMPSTPTQMLMGLNISSTFCILLVHFSSVVPTLKLCSHLRMWVQCWPPVFTAAGSIRAAIFLRNDALPKAANCNSDVRIATNHMTLNCVCGEASRP